MSKKQSYLLIAVLSAMMMILCFLSPVSAKDYGAMTVKGPLDAQEEVIVGKNGTPSVNESTSNFDDTDLQVSDVQDASVQNPGQATLSIAGADGVVPGVISPKLYFLKSRGSLTTPTLVVDGDPIGIIDFYGWTDTYALGARISAQASFQWYTGSVSNDAPTDLIFYTRRDGGSALDEAGRFTYDNNLEVTEDVLVGGTLEVTDGYFDSLEGLVLGLNFNSQNHDQASSETILDSSIYENHGLNYGAPLLNTGGMNGGGVYAPENVLGKEVRGFISEITKYPFTMSTWFKANGSDDGQLLGIGKNSEFLFYSMRLLVDGRILITTRPSGTTEHYSVSTYDDDEWHLLTGVWLNDTVSYMYVDGSYLSARDTDSRPYVAMDRYTVGDDPDTSKVRPFNGSIDDCRIYNRALSANEIKSLFFNRGESPDSFISQRVLKAGAGALTTTYTLSAEHIESTDDADVVNDLTAGTIASDSTIVAATSITATTGNIAASSGNVTASGNISTVAGTVSGEHIESTDDAIIADILRANSVLSTTTVIAIGNISTVLGTVSAEQITSTDDITATGDISTGSGTVHGDSVTAADGVTADGTVQGEHLKSTDDAEIGGTFALGLTGTVLEVKNAINDSFFLMGQDSTHGFELTWQYDGTPANGEAWFKTAGYNNNIHIEGAEVGVGLPSESDGNLNVGGATGTAATKLWAVDSVANGFTTTITNQATDDTAAAMELICGTKATNQIIAVFTDSAAGADMGGIDYDGTSGAFIVPSDEVLKDGITTSTRDDLQRVRRTQVPEFHWKSRPAGEKVVSFTAQKLEKMFPEAVGSHRFFHRLPFAQPNRHGFTTRTIVVKKNNRTRLTETIWDAPTTKSVVVVNDDKTTQTEIVWNAPVSRIVPVGWKDNITTSTEEQPWVDYTVKTIRPSSLIAPMFRAIQQLDRENQRQKKQINAGKTVDAAQWVFMATMMGFIGNIMRRRKAGTLPTDEDIAEVDTKKAEAEGK